MTEATEMQELATTEHHTFFSTSGSFRKILVLAFEVSAPEPYPAFT